MSDHDKAIIEAAKDPMTPETALKELRDLADVAELRFSMLCLYDLVDGWQKHTNERHRAELGCTPKTTCGAVYHATDAMRALRAKLDEIGRVPS